MMPVSELDAWMAKPEEERKEGEAKFMQEWNDWLASHKDSVLKTISMGKTKVVTAGGVEDVRSEYMMSSYVQAESLEAAAEIFKNHPHLKMGQGRIEIVETKEMDTMQAAS